MDCTSAWKKKMNSSEPFAQAALKFCLPWITCQKLLAWQENLHVLVMDERMALFSSPITQQHLYKIIEGLTFSFLPIDLTQSIRSLTYSTCENYVENVLNYVAVRNTFQSGIFHR